VRIVFGGVDEQAATASSAMKSEPLAVRLMFPQCWTPTPTSSSWPLRLAGGFRNARRTS
jgi:hypothetical protein